MFTIVVRGQSIHTGSQRVGFRLVGFRLLQLCSEMGQWISPARKCCNSHLAALLPRSDGVGPFPRGEIRHRHNFNYDFNLSILVHTWKPDMDSTKAKVIAGQDSGTGYPLKSREVVGGW